MDHRDLEIVSFLQKNARTSNSEIARALGIAPSAVLERVRKLERRGVLRGYTARVDPAAVGQSLLAFIFVQADERPGGENLGSQLAALPEAQEVHHIAGEDCYLIKVRCASTEALGQFLRERLGAFEPVRRTRSVVVLGTVKESPELRLPERVAEAGREPA